MGQDGARIPSGFGNDAASRAVPLIWVSRLMQSQQRLLSENGDDLTCAQPLLCASSFSYIVQCQG